MGKKVGDIGEEKRCGTLRMGLFFDGTGNDDHSVTKYSNVKKLFDVYPNQIDPHTDQVGNKDAELYPKVMSAYIRGVGSRDEALVKRDLARYKYDMKVHEQKITEYENILKEKGRGYGTYINAQQQLDKHRVELEEMKKNKGTYVPDGALVETILGGALGVGGIERLTGMLWYIDVGIRLYFDQMKLKNKDGKGHYPKHLEFDIFGFSRGAAQARHFVNVLKQKGDWWSISQKYEQGKVKVRTLNLFDTVGSFGIPGKDIDPGFSFYINPSWVTDSITHYVADDEYRYNFDGQFIGSNDTDYPIDKLQGKIVEHVVLGAHSDVGGGYSSGLEHGISNNDLAKVYLNMMYERCVEKSVPLMVKPSGNKWKIPEELNELIKYFNKQYKTHGNKLKIAHKKLREWQSAEGDVFLDKDVLISKDPTKGKSFLWGYVRVTESVDNRTTIPTRKVVEETSFLGVTLKKYAKEEPLEAEDNHSTKPSVQEHIGNPNFEALPYIAELYEALGSDMMLYNAFVRKSNHFHNTYIHINHTVTIAGAPYAPFGAEQSKVGSILHRDYFTPKYENMIELTKKSRKVRMDSIRDNCVPKTNNLLAKANVLKATGQCVLGAGSTYIGTMNKTFDKLVGIKFKDF